MIGLFKHVCRYKLAALLFLRRVLWAPRTCSEDDAQQNAFLTRVVIPALIKHHMLLSLLCTVGPVLLNKEQQSSPDIFISSHLISSPWNHLLLSEDAPLAEAFCLSVRLGSCLIAWFFFAFRWPPHQIRGRKVVAVVIIINNRKSF